MRLDAVTILIASVNVLDLDHTSKFFRQRLEDGNITFSEELDFDIQGVQELLDDSASRELSFDLSKGKLKA